MAISNAVAGIAVLLLTAGTLMANPLSPNDERPPAPTAAGIRIAATDQSEAPAQPAAPPGIVIAHSPKTSGIYVGSPGLAVLPNGDYIASHDEFGPKSTEDTLAVTQIFRSADRGATWSRIATIHGAFWST